MRTLLLRRHRLQRRAEDGADTHVIGLRGPYGFGIISEVVAKVPSPLKTGLSASKRQRSSAVRCSFQRPYIW